MLYLLHFLSDSVGFFNIFKYITFRAFGAGVTAFILSILLGAMMIRLLSKHQLMEKIRDDGPEHHKVKAGTPTMGGAFVITSIVITTILWANVTSWVTWFVLIFTVSYAAIGFWDDWLKLKSGKGMRARTKLSLQIVLGFVFISTMLLLQTDFSMSLGLGTVENYSFSSIVLPFFKHAVYNLGWLYIPFAIAVVVGASNAVNLTDGLDGLAAGPLIIVSTTYIIFAYLSGHFEFARYLQIPYVQGSGELAVFLAALSGACLGFLWYNSHPAEVFMGDVGSLGLGAAIGSVALLVKQELLLIIVGGVFVAEVMSVIIQVASFKLRGKRVFKMAPIHHHFELIGWSETKVVIRFWIISLVLAIVALSTLKLR